MKIFIANYRYFISGGPERYMFNVIDALTEQGNDIIPFSIHYTRNRSTPYAPYFIEPLGSRDEVFFRQQRMSSKSAFKTVSRLFYARDVERAVTKLVNETKPQIAYVLHYLRKLSPSLLVGLKKAGIPIVVRLSDYAMLCPQAPLHPRRISLPTVHSRQSLSQHKTPLRAKQFGCFIAERLSDLVPSSNGLF